MLYISYLVIPTFYFMLEYILLLDLFIREVQSSSQQHNSTTAQHSTTQEIEAACRRVVLSTVLPSCKKKIFTRAPAGSPRDLSLDPSKIFLSTVSQH